MRIAALSLVAVSLGLATAAGATDDGVFSDGPLSDQDFLRLTACGAPPGGDCQGPVVRWPETKARDLTVAFLPVPPDVAPETARRVSRAIDQAIAALNDAGAGVALRRTDRRSADIRVFLTPTAEGEPLSGVQGLSDGQTMEGVGYYTVWWDGGLRITDALILISASIADRDIRSVVLEEITQSLGLRYDISNAWYEGRSIVAQNSNTTIRIEGQDRDVLRLLYPPPP